MIYAVGDIHGRADLLERLLRTIHQDALPSTGPTKSILIFLGDYIDRGPSSKAVIDLVLELRRDGVFEVQALKGNHEQSLLAFLADPIVGPTWCEHGGRETLASYQVAAPGSRTDLEGWAAARTAFAEALPAEHLAFFNSLSTHVVHGDYVFVHAGLRPGVPLSAQTEHDMLWIRQDFLKSRGAFDKVMVHGHTPVEQPYTDNHRIGIDTGAYATGVLTAVKLTDGERRFIQASFVDHSRYRD